jgi:hypothetical protein
MHNVKVVYETPFMRCYICASAGKLVFFIRADLYARTNIYILSSYEQRQLPIICATCGHVVNTVHVKPQHNTFSRRTYDAGARTRDFGIWQKETTLRKSFVVERQASWAEAPSRIWKPMQSIKWTRLMISWPISRDTRYHQESSTF